MYHSIGLPNYRIEIYSVIVGFRSRFGRVQELKDQKADVGDVAIIKHETRYIYYLVTKSAVYGKPKYDDLKSSLQAMKKHMVRHYLFFLFLQIVCFNLLKLV